MRKFFNYALLAAALLVGVNVNAESEAKIKAKIGAIEYPSVKDAIAAAEGGVETRIDIQESGTEQMIIIPEDKDIVLNLNGYSITSDFDNDQVDWFEGNAVIANKGKLRIVGEGKALFSLSLSLFSEATPVALANRGEMIIDGGTFVAAVLDIGMGFPFMMAFPVIWNEGEGAILTINGGAFLHDEYTNAEWPFGFISKANNAEMQVNGGVFSFNQVGTEQAGTALADFLGEGCSIEPVAYTNPQFSWITSVYQVVKSEGGLVYDEDMEITGDVEGASVTIKEGATVTVKTGAKLIAGDNGLIFADATSKLIIEPKATVIVGQQGVTSSTTDNIELTMDGLQNEFSYLLIVPNTTQALHPYATVSLTSKAYKKASGDYVFQRFGVPSVAEDIKMRDILPSNVPTAIYNWNYDGTGWKSMDLDDIFVPFAGYDMTANVDEAGKVYTFRCQLVGNGNPELALHKNQGEIGDWNIYANSYTAPIDVTAVINDIMDNYRNDLSAAIYVHKADGDYWDPISYNDIRTAAKLGEKIEPLQSFIIGSLQGAIIDNYELKYDEFVYNPLVNPAPAPAPKFDMEQPMAAATIIVKAADGSKDRVEVIEDATFSNAFDNGYDVEKFMNDRCFNLYLNVAEGQMAYVANSNIENSTLSIATLDQTHYTMSFENVTLKGYAIRDNETNATITINEANEYSFLAPANSTMENRFSIIRTAGAPTGCEQVNAAIKPMKMMLGNKVVIVKGTRCFNVLGTEEK